MGQLSIENAAKALLDEMQAQLVVNGVVVPDRVAVIPGTETPWDGEELYLNWIGITVGQPQAPDQPQGRSLNPYELTFFYEFRLVLLRDTAKLSGRGRQGGIPKPATLEGSFSALAGDAEAVLQSLVTIHSDGLLVPIQIPFWYGPIASVGPEGSLSGLACPISFQAGFANTKDF